MDEAEQLELEQRLGSTIGDAYVLASVSVYDADGVEYLADSRRGERVLVTLLREGNRNDPMCRAHLLAHGTAGDPNTATGRLIETGTDVHGDVFAVRTLVSEEILSGDIIEDDSYGESWVAATGEFEIIEDDEADFEGPTVWSEEDGSLVAESEVAEPEVAESEVVESETTGLETADFSDPLGDSFPGLDDFFGNRPDEPNSPPPIPGKEQGGHDFHRTSTRPASKAAVLKKGASPHLVRPGSSEFHNIPTTVHQIPDPEKLTFSVPDEASPTPKRKRRAAKRGDHTRPTVQTKAKRLKLPTKDQANPFADNPTPRPSELPGPALKDKAAEASSEPQKQPEEPIAAEAAALSLPSLAPPGAGSQASATPPQFSAFKMPKLKAPVSDSTTPATSNDDSGLLFPHEAAPETGDHHPGFTEERGPETDEGVLDDVLDAYFDASFGQRVSSSLDDDSKE